MIRIIKLYLFRLLYLFQFLSYIGFLLNKRKQKIFFVDLDNTLANTWPQRLNMQLFDWQYLPVNDRVLDFVKKYAKDRKLEVVVLSARPLSAINSTRYWLSQIADMEDCRFYLTPNADSKFKYILLASRLGRLEAVIDDCSHSHEFGTPRLYDNLIQKIRSTGTHYFDFDFITKLQNN